MTPRSTARRRPALGQDPLTDLATRSRFVQRLVQAEQDRDPVAVAVIDVADFARVNGRLGFDAGDDLLRSLGTALALHHSTRTVLARVGDDQFGVVTVGDEVDDLHRWISPIVISARSAAQAWAEQQSATTRFDVQRPALRIGMAHGFSVEVWHEANAALTEAKRQRGDEAICAAEPLASDESVSIRWQRGELSRSVEQAIDEATVRTATDEIDLPDRSMEPGSARTERWSWVRLSPRIPGHGTEIRSSLLNPIAGRRLDRWLLARAVETVAGGRGPNRVTVPIPSELSHARSLGETVFPLLERHRVPPGLIAIECRLDHARGDGSGQDSSIEPLLQEAAGVGLSVVATGATGGHHHRRLMARWPLSFVAVDADLVADAVSGDRTATAELAVLRAWAEESELPLIAPSGQASDETAQRLRDLGVDYAQVPGRKAAVGRQRSQ